MSLGIVSTIGQRCKRCYSCVRECPARAIRVLNGQAVVIGERCISCGHCVKVCSQHAKQIKSDVEKVLRNYLPSGNAVAMLAPSFPAAFPNNYEKISSALKSIGFKKVTEAAFGADLVSEHYKNYFEKFPEKTIISSPCPAVYNLIEKYHAGLVSQLAEIVSPMIAMGRYLKKNYGSNSKVVFIGPCVAKKSEYVDYEVDDAVDAVLTFTELKDIFQILEVNIDEKKEEELDPPHAFLGKSFSITGGLLKTAEVSSDILQKETIIVEGKNRVVDLMYEIAEGKLKSKFVDILFCEGCINGPAIDTDLSYYVRREKVVNYIHDNINSFDKLEWKSNIYNSRDLNLKRKFSNKSQRKPMPSEGEIKEILARTNKLNKSDELNCGSCGYPSCREYAVAIAKDLAEDDMCLPYLIEKLEIAYKELQVTEEQLHSAEKLASIGQLAAGVAHEINNPLGTIMLYASMMKRKMEKSQCADEQNSEDLKLIIEEANRCKNIVSNLLNFARQGKVRVGNVDVHELLTNIIKIQKLNPQFSEIIFNIDCHDSNTIIEGDADQLKQVFINLFNNSCEAVESSEIKKVTISISKKDENLIIDLIDTGCGIPAENLNKIFTPFFTTKKIGKGTGLGLAISYGIIKMHKGDIKVKSTVGDGTDFTITLPLKHNTINPILN